MSKISSILSKIGHSYQVIFRVLAFLLALFLVVWQMPRTIKFKYEYQKMRPWQYESLYAPFNFPIYKTAEQLKIEEEASLKDFYPIFVFDVNATKNNKEAMLQDFNKQWYGSDSDKMKNKAILEKIYDTIETENQIKIFSDFYLPISLIKKTNKELEEVQKKYNMEEAKALGIEELQKQLDEEFENKDKIVNKNINTYEQEDGIDVYVTYEVLENIGTNEKIVF